MYFLYTLHNYFKQVHCCLYCYTFNGLMRSDKISNNACKRSPSLLSSKKQTFPRQEVVDCCKAVFSCYKKLGLEGRKGIILYSLPHLYQHSRIRIYHCGSDTSKTDTISSASHAQLPADPLLTFIDLPQVLWTLLKHHCPLQWVLDVWRQHRWEPSTQKHKSLPSCLVAS